ncbi:dTDP-4-dehydrorhamnose reductase [Phenylobacterium sp.]|jgi:dTDP-4-dehydrorhamnose reductase|uniref:dTDP-4-dehydrorhamnose reductase n=1 Tax=Phenylobacterium sp. TaxID=1871053 RepID=UPI002F93C906
MSVRVLQFGTTGQLARELIRHAPDYPVELTALSRAECDLTDPEGAARMVWERKPDLVIVAAAYTAVDQAETDGETAHLVNAEAPSSIVGMCGLTGPAMVHFSTDFVFDGRKGSPYVETDEPDPLGVYGASKLSGETTVVACCPRALVLRTSWVVSAHGKNFVKTMLRLGRAGQPLRVVDDQRGRPTAAGDLARFVLSQAERLAKGKAGDPCYGLFHFANAGEVSWRGFAEEILRQAMGASAPPVQPITTAEYPTPATRPAYSVLDTGKLERTFGYTPRPWREALSEILAELAAEEAAHA